MNNQIIDSQAKASKPYEPRTMKTEPHPQKPKVVTLVRKRRRGKKSPIVVCREDVDDDKNTR